MTEDEYKRWRSRYFAPLAQAHGLGSESDDPYALRHVYASLRVAAGHPVAHIEASMGTSLVSKVYASVFREYEGRPLDIATTIGEARVAALAG